MDGFRQKLKKVVRIVLYRSAISQADRRKASLYTYQLPCNNGVEKMLNNVTVIAIQGKPGSAFVVGKSDSDEAGNGKERS